MELRDALRLLRSEIGFTQSELANAVNVGYSAESRWENKNTRPNKASSLAILALAREHCVSAVCLDTLTSILMASRADDRADREMMAHVTEQMKLERRELLTSEQLKETIDNLDLAIIGHRLYSDSPVNIEIFYHNSKYVEIFGYTEADFEERSRNNMYFSIPVESRWEYERRLKQLLSGNIRLKDFTMVIRGFKKDGSEIWLEIKAISLTRFSYGWDMFISCQDVTQRTEAERRYAEEVALRNAALGSFFASVLCDISENKVIRQRDITKVTSAPGQFMSAQDLFDSVAKALPDSGERDEFLKKFNRDSMLDDFTKSNVSGEIAAFNRTSGRWLSFVYALLRNPYNNHVEAAIYLRDIQKQMLSERLMGIVSESFFDYIGVIDTQSEEVESFYTSDKCFQYSVEGKRNYPEQCAEKLRLFGDSTDFDSISLPRIVSKLNKSRFYSTFLHLMGLDGKTHVKKVTYTYLDNTGLTIIVAQMDVTKLNDYSALLERQTRGE